MKKLGRNLINNLKTTLPLLSVLVLFLGIPYVLDWTSSLPAIIKLPLIVIVFVVVFTVITTVFNDDEPWLSIDIKKK